MRTERIWAIADRAKVKMWRRQPVETFDNQLVKDLVAMRQSGLFSGVWIDQGKIRIKPPDAERDDPAQSISAIQAHRLVDEWKRDQLFAPAIPAVPRRRGVDRVRVKLKLRRSA
jgi:hypothetical protein